MSPLRIVAWTAGVVLLGLLWIRAMSLRNARLVRPPVRGPDGRRLPETAIRYSDGEEVEALDVGEGPAFLLVPGADGMKETFAFQVPQFAAAGWRVVSGDLREAFPDGTELDRLVRDQVELLDARGIGRAAVLGQSLGGAIAMRLAVLHPERVRALVLVNTLARVSYSHVGLNRTLLIPLAMVTTRYLPTWMARLAARAWSRLDVWVFDSSPGWRRVVDYALDTGPRTVPPSVSTRRVECLKGHDLRPQLPSIEAPTLVVKGALDTYVPVSWAREIADLVPGADYVEIPGTGHCAHVSMPELVNPAVLDWLRRAAAADAPSPAAKEAP